MMFRLFPAFGADPRTTAEIVNGIMNGKTNNTGRVTLNTGNATTTTINNERISRDSLIILVPVSDAAEADTAPYGAFQSLADQTAAAANTAYAITYDTTDFSNGVSVASSSRITVRNYGIYNFQTSIQFTNTDSQEHAVSVWFRKNGTDIINSNTQLSIIARHGSINGSIVFAVNFYFELQANDYVEMMWSTTSTTVKLDYLPTQTTPTRPATPSVIATMQYIAPSSTSNVYVSAQTSGSATLTHFANSTADKTYGYVIVG
jgi:uncharacterized lipoprotein YbaY